jgi:hypothetical protein
MSESKARILYYQLPGDWMLLVGASDADNDYLTTVWPKTKTGGFMPTASPAAM